MYFLLTSPC